MGRAIDDRVRRVPDQPTASIAARSFRGPFAVACRLTVPESAIGPDCGDAPVLGDRSDSTGPRLRSGQASQCRQVGVDDCRGGRERPCIEIDRGVNAATERRHGRLDLQAAAGKRHVGARAADGVRAPIQATEVDRAFGLRPIDRSGAGGSQIEARPHRRGSRRGRRVRAAGCDGRRGRVNGQASPAGVERIAATVDRGTARSPSAVLRPARPRACGAVTMRSASWRSSERTETPGPPPADHRTRRSRPPSDSSACRPRRPPKPRGTLRSPGFRQRAAERRQLREAAVELAVERAGVESDDGLTGDDIRSDTEPDRLERQRVRPRVETDRGRPWTRAFPCGGRWHPRCRPPAARRACRRDPRPPSPSRAARRLRRHRDQRRRAASAPRRSQRREAQRGRRSSTRPAFPRGGLRRLRRVSRRRQSASRR